MYRLHEPTLWPHRPASLALATALVTALALLAGCSDKPQAARRMATVKLLPDTPPPPPPKVEEKKPEVQKEEKPQPQAPQPKPMETPQAQALRSDEAAGDGPGNGMVAGAVSKDYNGEQLGNGNVIGGAPADDGRTRLATTSFANAATRALNEHLARERELRRADYRVRVNLWLTPQGSLQRIELVEGTGNFETDEILRTALARFPGPGAPPPERMPQPLRLLVTNRMLG